MPTEEQVAAFWAANAAVKKCREQKDTAELKIIHEADWIVRFEKSNPNPNLDRLREAVEERWKKSLALEDAYAANDAAFKAAYGDMLKTEQT